MTTIKVHCIKKEEQRNSNDTFFNDLDHTERDRTFHPNAIMSNFPKTTLLMLNLTQIHVELSSVQQCEK